MKFEIGLMIFKHKKLANGLNIVAELNNDAQSAAFGFFVRTGARDESNEINGVSHYLEHMLFKGTETISAFDVNLRFDELGAQYNAHTTEENTAFYSATLPEQIYKAIELWCQMMRPALRDEDFDMEKNVILEEIAMYKDLPQFDVLENCRALHFGSHPCAKSVLGSIETIKALTSSQMRDYFNRRYVPNNLTAVIAGNFDFEKACNLIETGCGIWPSAPADRVTEYFAGTAKKDSQSKKNLNCQHICLISPTVSYQDTRSYAATLLAKIIGDDSNSRFFWDLIDTAVAESASMNCEAMDGVGAYYSYIRTSAENGPKALQIVENIFKSIKENKISIDELQKAKNKVLSGITIKNEIPMGRLLDVGVNWVYLGKYRPIEEEIELINKATLDDIHSLLEQFPLDNFTQYIIGPAI
ncbi:MAG: pitrilysin family protein [Phycisphaerales bacterium]